jgi:hypothetical protein
MRRALANVFTDSLSASSDQDVELGTKCRAALQLWHVLREVLPAGSTSTIAQSILLGIDQNDVSAADADAQQHWADLVAALLSVGSPHRISGWLNSAEADVSVRRALWLALARECNSCASLDTSLEGFEAAVALATAPFTVWTFSPSEWGVWQGVVTTAIQRGAAHGKSPAEIVDSVCESITSFISEYVLVAHINDFPLTVPV